MKLDKSRKSSNLGKGGYGASPYETAKEPDRLVHPSLEKLRKTGVQKRIDADLKRVTPAVAAKMDTAAKNDKMTNVANAIRKAQGKGAISRNPFDKARNK